MVLAIAAVPLMATAVVVLAHSPADASSTPTAAAPAVSKADRAKESDRAARREAKKAEARERAAEDHARVAAPARGSSERGTSQKQSSPSANGGSLYRGRYYSADYEAFRQCVVHRESRGDYAARNTRSGASGAYQFMLTTSNEVARRMGHPELVGSPAGTWSRALQDEAFFTLFDHGRGIGHWGGSCG